MVARKMALRKTTLRKAASKSRQPKGQPKRMKRLVRPSALAAANVWCSYKGTSFAGITMAPYYRLSTLRSYDRLRIRDKLSNWLIRNAPAPIDIASHRKRKRTKKDGGLLPFKEAPLDIWYEIISHCDTKTLQMLREVSKTFKDIAEHFYYSRTWFEANWVDILSSSRTIVVSGSYPPSGRSICFNAAKKFQKVRLNVGINYSTSPRLLLTPKLGSIRSVFPQAKIFLFSRELLSAHRHQSTAAELPPNSVWIHSTIRLVGDHSPPSESIGDWRHFSTFNIANLETSLEEIQSNVRFIGPPSTWWMSRIWEIGEKVTIAARHTLRRKGAGHPIGFNYSNDVEWFRVNDMDEKFRKDLLALYTAMADFRAEVGGSGAPERRKFEKELEEELMAWPDGPYYSESLDLVQDGTEAQRERAIRYAKTVREGPLLKTILAT